MGSITLLYLYNLTSQSCPYSLDQIKPLPVCKLASSF